jgi:hypothetical protein
LRGILYDVPVTAVGNKGVTTTEISKSTTTEGMTMTVAEVMEEEAVHQAGPSSSRFGS